MAVHGMDCNSAAKDIEPRMQELKVAKSLESVTVASKRVYWVVVRDAGCKGYLGYQPVLRCHFCAECDADRVYRRCCGGGGIGVGVCGDGA
ncbi:hypothetical protein MVEG_09694 [Podila verticillata NRRL 6337]|nr:hypothetical protein MVEG_09694 [Podila verticillata NRRL 6337]